MRLTILALIVLYVAALVAIIALFLRSVEADHRAAEAEYKVALAEQEARACFRGCWDVADACEHALDTCVEMLAGGLR